MRGWGIAALPPQCRKAGRSEGGGGGTGDKRLASVWECRKAGYHGALWLGDFTAVPCEAFKMHKSGGEENNNSQKKASKHAVRQNGGCNGIIITS